MKRVQMWWVAALSASAVWLTAGCDSGGDSGAEDTGPTASEDVAAEDASDASDDADAYKPGGAPLGESWYKLTLTLPEGPLVIERDITDNGTAVIFGSTHLAPPALTLAVHEKLTSPKTIHVKLDFGFLIGNVDYTTTTPDAGPYPFTPLLPAVTIELPVDVVLFSSQPQLAEGSIVITDYSQEPGGLFAGTVSGTLVDKYDPNSSAQIEGEFHIVLPNTASGQ